MLVSPNRILKILKVEKNCKVGGKIGKNLEKKFGKKLEIWKNFGNLEKYLEIWSDFENLKKILKRFEKIWNFGKYLEI